MADFPDEPVEPLYPTVDWEPGNVNGAPPEHEEPPPFEPDDRWGPEEEQNSRSSELSIRPIGIIDPTKIPPRQWVLGRYLLKGFVTVLVAPGGVGKTSWALAASASIITGRQLLGHDAWLPGKVLYLNLEDPREELERRTAAVIIKHDLSSEEVAEGLLVHTKESQETAPIAIVTEEAGRLQVSPIKGRLISLIKQHDIRVLVVDPFVNCHAVEENSNTAVNAVASAWREIARDTDCAILLVHHVRKGSAAPGDADAARGATALIGAARVALTLTAMTDTDATTLDIDEKERREFVRLDFSKSNMAPSAGDARWYRLSSVNLGNGIDDPVFPRGDDVQVIEPHTFPGPFDGLGNAEIREVLSEIDKGLTLDGQLQRYSRSVTAKQRWAGKLLMEIGGRNKGQAKHVINTWIENGLIYEEDTKDAKHRDRKGLLVRWSQAPGDVI